MRGLMLLLLFLPVLSFGSESDKQFIEATQVKADQGNAEARYWLGGMYDLGIGAPKDDKEAVKWYRLAADQGHAKTQFNLGVMYAYGRGVPKDEKEAVKWFRLAADQWNAEAQYWLGGMYGKGQGVPKDNALAYMWANIAGANGLDVEEFRESLQSQMSQADIAKAQEKTTQYIKDNPDVY